VAEAKYEFFEAEWKNVSEEAKDLVRKLLVVDPNVRLNMAQVLEHSFLKDAVAALSKTMASNEKTPTAAVAATAKGEVGHKKTPTAAVPATAKGELGHRTGATKSPTRDAEGPYIIELDKKTQGGCCIIA
jgi:serine/threonine protein kinase